jgi:hypothetical protein
MKCIFVLPGLAHAATRTLLGGLVVRVHLLVQHYLAAGIRHC